MTTRTTLDYYAEPGPLTSAGPRATARLLAGLPFLGLIMAAVLGADPLAFLFGTLPGLACLLAGVGLNATGALWTHRLARNAGEVP